MKIGNSISLSKRIGPATTPMGGVVHNNYTYGWAVDLSKFTSTNQGTGSPDPASQYYPTIAAAANWDFDSSNIAANQGWKITRAAGGTGFGNWIGTPEYWQNFPAAATSSGSGGVVPAGIVANNRYFAVVITYHTGSDYPEMSSANASRLYQMTTASPGKTLIDTDARPPRYINGVEVSTSEGSALDGRNARMGLYPDTANGGDSASNAKANAEKGIPLTIVYDLALDSDYSSLTSSTTVDRLRGYQALSLQNYNIQFTVHGFIFSSDSPENIHVTQLPVPIDNPT